MKTSIARVTEHDPGFVAPVLPTNTTDLARPAAPRYRRYSADVRDTELDIARVAVHAALELQDSLRRSWRKHET